MVTSAAEGVEVSMDEDVVENVGGEVYKVEYYEAEEVLDEAAAHMKMVLEYQMSPVNLRI